jgi:hypothetical protein
MVGHEKFSDATDLFLKWISKKNVFIEKFSINGWNLSVCHFLQNNEKNNRNSFLNRNLKDMIQITQRGRDVKKTRVSM